MIAAVFLSACAQEPASSQEATRLATSDLVFFNDPIEQGVVAEQVNALNQSAKRLVRVSTVNGAAIGAAVGCGLSVLSAANAKNCVSGAAKGGAGGAVIGNITGKKDVSRRIALVSPSAVVRGIRNANAQFRSVEAELATLIAAQESELNSLTMQLATGQIDQRAHDRAVGRIRRERAALADALTLGAQDARRASRNLEEAAARGQSGLEWHIGATSTLADEVMSARSTIELF